MTRLLTYILLLACCLSGRCEKSIQWLGQVHDFGAFNEDDERVSAYFYFVNTGDEPVLILQAVAQCGCTVPSYSSEPIAPGDTATITVQFNPAGRAGRFNKNVYVRTDASHERFRLTVRGAVIGNESTIKGRYPVEMGALKLHNGVAMLGRVNRKGTKSVFIDGYNQSADTLCLRFGHVPGYLTVMATPEVVPPGEQVNLSLHYKGEDNDEWGMLADSLQIIASEGTAYWLPTVVIAEEDFSTLTPQELANAPVSSVDRESVDLDRVPGRSAEGMVTLSNHGKSPLKIRRIYSPDGDVQCVSSPIEVKPGRSAELKVRYTAKDASQKVINSKLIIITNDPVTPARTIRVVGTRQ